MQMILRLLPQVPFLLVTAVAMGGKLFRNQILSPDPSQQNKARCRWWPFRLLRTDRRP